MVDAGMSQTLARQLLAFAGIAMMWDWIDDEDPRITGTTPMRSKGSRELSYRGAPPAQSIRIGDTWYPYARVEPFATAIAWTVDTINGIKRGEPGRAILGSTVRQLKTKSYMEGVGDAIEAFEGLFSSDEETSRDPLDATLVWASKFAASWVPNIYRQTVAGIQNEIPETRTWGNETDLFKQVVVRAAQRARIPGVETVPRFDLWGRRITYRDTFGGPATDFIWKVFSPIKNKSLSRVKQMDLALMRWRALHPDDNMIWREPPKFMSVGHGKNKKNVYFTDQQYSTYSEYSGKLGFQLASKIKIDPDNPTEHKIKAIKSKVSRAQRVALRRLKSLWKEGKSGASLIAAIDREILEAK